MAIIIQDDGKIWKNSHLVILFVDYYGISHSFVVSIDPL